MTIAVQVTRIKKKSENATIIGETNVVSNRFKLKRATNGRIGLVHFDAYKSIAVSNQVKWDKMMVAMSFLRGLLIGSVKASLVIYGFVFCLISLLSFLHYKGNHPMEWIENNIPGINPGSERTRLSLFSVMNYILLTYYLFMFTVIGFDFQGWIYSKNWGKGNAETFGRRFYYIFLLPFTAQFLMRIIYDIQIYCSCEDNAVTPYLKVIFGFIPIIFNIIFATWYLMVRLIVCT